MKWARVGCVRGEYGYKIGRGRMEDEVVEMWFYIVLDFDFI